MAHAEDCPRKGVYGRKSIKCTCGDTARKQRAAANPANRCKHCGGPKDMRNPTGTCDHLYWPDNLTPEARIANGLECPHHYETRCNAERVACHVCGEPESWEHYARALRAKLEGCS